MSILVTGASGFAGKHLLNYLRQQQTDKCIGLSRSSVPDKDSAICDLLNYEQVKSVLSLHKPAFIYHMAGSFSNIYETDFKTNVSCAKNLLDALSELKLPARLLLMGSAAEYGEVEAANNPISETQALHPISFYGWTKAAQSQLASVYAAMHGVDVVVARTFNLLGAGASEKLFVGRVQKQIQDVLAGNAKRISVGNVDAIRDYLEIEQACKMYHLIANKGLRGEIYNVGSGKAVVMRDLLKQMLQQAGLDYSIVDEMAYTKNNTVTETSVNYANIEKYKKLAGTGL